MRTIKSGKHGKLEIHLTRAKRRARRNSVQSEVRFISPAVQVDAYFLAHSNSYGEPEFVSRGYYQDIFFRCKDCGAEGVWKAERQKWWYEVAKGDVFTTAVRCKACRAKERLRKETARRIQQEGMQAKLARKNIH